MEIPLVNRLSLLFIFFVSSIAFAADKAEQLKKGELLDGKVVGVTDGDTLTLLFDKTQYKIRLDGIDAPESGQPYGTKSKQALSEKVFGKEVKVISRGQDKYGRTLGIIKIDKRVINTEMVKEGWAWHYKEYNKSPTLSKSETEAKEGKLGLWEESDAIAPWDWRHKPELRKTAIHKLSQSPPRSLRTPPTNPPQSQTQAQPPEQKYWITNSSSKRHNSSCRYYGNSKGHWGGANEGVACKICGG